MKDTQLVPRVEIPNLTEFEQERIASFKKEAEWKKRTQTAFLTALFRKCKPFTGVHKPQPKPTKHQKQIAEARARSTFLVSVGRSRKPVTTDA